MPSRLKPRSTLSRIQTYQKKEKSTDMSMTSRYTLYLIHSANVSCSKESCELNKNFVNLTTALHFTFTWLGHFAEDQVYMEDEAWLDECVLNETGKIYTGNWEQIGHRPWNYAQVRTIFLNLSSFSTIRR